jgi:hypothetical protein
MHVIEPLRPNTSFYMLPPPLCLSFSPFPTSASTELGRTQHLQLQPCSCSQQFNPAPVVAAIT